TTEIAKNERLAAYGEEDAALVGAWNNLHLSAAPGDWIWTRGTNDMSPIATVIKPQFFIPSDGRRIPNRAAISSDGPSVDGNARRVRLVNRATGKLLAVEDGSLDSGARAILSDAPNAASSDSSHEWYMVQADERDFYKLVNRGSPNALGVDASTGQ